jgi:CRISPR-associated protein Cas1
VASLAEERPIHPCRRQVRVTSDVVSIGEKGTMQVALNEFGSYLGVKGLNFIIKNGKRNSHQIIPFHIADEIAISSGGSVSTKALAWASIYGTKVLVTSHAGRPLGVFLPLDYDMHVETRVRQYQSHNNEKGLNIARTILKAKIMAQASLLDRYNLGFDSHPYLRKIERMRTKPGEKARTALFSIEGEFSQRYVKQLVKLFPKSLQTDARESYRATAALNNIFNLSYEVLRWEVYKSILSSHLDPYLGYLHSIEHSKPSLVCDVQEPYRAWIDRFLVEYCRTLSEKDLQMRFDGRKPRIFLKHPASSRLIEKLNRYLNTKVKKQRTHKYGSRSRIKTIIQEDTERLARYIRNELPSWDPTTFPIASEVERCCKDLFVKYNDPASRRRSAQESRWTNKRDN